MNNRIRGLTGTRLMHSAKLAGKYSEEVVSALAAPFEVVSATTLEVSEVGDIIPYANAVVRVEPHLVDHTDSILSAIRAHPAVSLVVPQGFKAVPSSQEHDELLQQHDEPFANPSE